MSKDKLWNIYVMLFVNLYRDAFAIIVDANEPLGLVNLDLQKIHFTVSLVIVSCIDQHLVKDLVERGDIRDFFICKLKIVGTQDPLLRFLHLNASDVCIWTK